MSKNDLETLQLSLDFTLGEQTFDKVQKNSHLVGRPLLAMVVSNNDRIASSKQVERPPLSLARMKDIYSPEVTLALHKYADTLGW